MVTLMVVCIDPRDPNSVQVFGAHPVPNCVHLTHLLDITPLLSSSQDIYHVRHVSGH